jgi:hypothetical protein
MPKRKMGPIQVRTFPKPPSGFDPLTASPKDLLRFGIPRRPDQVAESHAAGKWVKAFRQYPQFNHVIPEFKELPHRHGPNRRVGKNTQGTVNGTSSNWSGSVLFASAKSQFAWIIGQWTVPSSYSPNQGSKTTYYSSAWLGIDGDGSNDVLQAGTESDSDGTCYAWWEWFPAYSMAINNFPVKPGDVISLLICATSSTTAWISVANLTAKQYTNFDITAPAGTTLVGNCAEAVIERPSINNKLAQLPRYGEVYFDEVTAYLKGGVHFDIGTGTPLSMVADDGITVISTPTFEGNSDMLSCAYTGP